MISRLDAGALVERQRLIERLRGADTPAVLLHAPAGYGKSVLLAQWARRDRRPFAFLTLTDAHDDPALLLLALIEALAPVEPLPESLRETLQSARPNLDVIANRLEAALAERATGAVLVLDELEHLRSEASLRLLAALLNGTGGRSRLALATRATPPIHVSRLQAEGRLTLLDARDLVMTPGEARNLLAEAGLRADEDEVETIVAKTEGWPVALYLAALSRRERPRASLPDAGFGGDERNLVEYMREELLATAAPEDVDFLLRVAVLDRLGGELCDFVLEAEGSGARLAELARRNLLLIPLDRRDEWFRMHSLLAEMLRTELTRRHPGDVARLGLRASLWWEGAGDRDHAVGFAIAAGDRARAARLIWEGVPEFNTSGRHATIERWIERIGTELTTADPHLAVTVAHGHLADGDGGGAEYWAGVARPLLAETADLADDLPAGLAMIDAAVARGGMARMEEAATLAAALLDHESPWNSMADLMAGTSAQLRGEPEHARASLTDSARRAAVWNAPLIQVLALAQLALLAATAEDWAEARILASQARAGIDRAGLVGRPSVALPMAVSAYVLAADQRRLEALADLGAGRVLLSRLRDFGPWYECETALALAAAAVELSEAGPATELVALARGRLDDIPDAPVLDAWIARLEAGIGRLSTSGLDELTPAELRVLRLLSSHLSYPQIADELVVSPNTVKTQVRSTFLKLGVSSRHEAVEACRQAGIARSG